jgi:cysteine dioxygenase
MDGLSGPAEIENVEQLLLRADVTREDMVQACKFSDVTYARNHLAKSPWYELIVLCWKHGQCSPIHDHFGSACGVRVIDGVATETIYEECSPGFVQPVSQHSMSKGEVIVTSDRDIHLITNEQESEDLITLHLYTPPLNMQFFELAAEFAPS